MLQQPGAPPHMYSHRDSYAPAQWARWLAVDDAFYALVGGRADTRKPSIGLVIDTERYAKWKERFTAQWANESKRRHGTRGVAAADVPEPLLQYLYERLLDAERLAPHAG